MTCLPPRGTDLPEALWIIPLGLLAYVFWHRPRAGVASGDYEDLLRAFHARLNIHSASFRIASLPFAAGGGYEDSGGGREDRGEGYEDWYLVGGWAELGDLNVSAVSDERRAPHDAAAEMAGEGWGAVYALVRGDAWPPARTRWLTKPRGESYEDFLGRLQATTVWQRQMALGPGPEFCVVEDDGEGPASPRAGRRVPVYEPSGAASRSSS
jgi:hypothetical protein